MTEFEGRSQGNVVIQKVGRQIQFGLDLAVFVVAFVFAYLLRFEFVLSEEVRHRLLAQLPFVVLIQFTSLMISGVYSFVWRYVGMAEIKAFVRAALFSVGPLLLLRLGLSSDFDYWRVPLSVILMDAMLAFVGVLALRVTRRALYERDESLRRQSVKGEEGIRRVLLAGAGRAGVMAMREIRGRGDLGLDPIGFVDDDPEKLGSVIHGVKVLGTTADLPRLAAELRVDQVVITMVRASRESIRGIVESCERVGLRCRIVPGLYEILDGQVEISRIRDVQIEDLLGREPVNLDEAGLRRFLSGKRILISGAGGSIGSELCRQVMRFEPERLLMVERAEFGLFQIERELGNLWKGKEIKALVADVGDQLRMREIFRQHRPEVVIHAAAHKHVPLMESNPNEAVKNNIFGTKVLGEVAGESGATVFVLISTDKAVNPSSVMGATKRMAELVVQDLDLKYDTRFVAVRFGNVLGSAGSVIPIFRDQIRKGGPVTVTNSEVNRYFMTIPEASQLVLQAGTMAEGGEIFILDMGKPVRILDLARDMITLSGLKPHVDIKIEFTGLRPGEKLYEELQLSHEGVGETKHPKIFVGKIAGMEPSFLQTALARLEGSCWHGGGDTHHLLGEMIPEALFDEAGASGLVANQGETEDSTEAKQSN